MIGDQLDLEQIAEEERLFDSRALVILKPIDDQLDQHTIKEERSSLKNWDPFDILLTYPGVLMTSKMSSDQLDLDQILEKEQFSLKNGIGLTYPYLIQEHW